MTAYEEFKKRRQMQLQNGARVLPTDLLDKSNHTTDETASTRMQICEQCPSLIKLTNQCKECGCVMTLKVKLKEAKCPLGKW